MATFLASRCSLSMDDTTRRLDAIDNELEIGFDQKFERKWRTLEIASQGVMC